VRNALCECAGIVQHEVFADRGVAVVADVNNGNFKSKLLVAQLHGERPAVGQKDLISAQQVECCIGSRAVVAVAHKRKVLSDAHGVLTYISEVSVRRQVKELLRDKSYLWLEGYNSSYPIVADRPGLTSIRVAGRARRFRSSSEPARQEDSARRQQRSSSNQFSSAN